MYNPKKLIKESKWDSNIFNKKVGVINLEKYLTKTEINELKKEIDSYDLVVVKDFTDDFKNSEIISNDLNGYIVDLNVQFFKKVFTNNKEFIATINEKTLLSSKDKSKVIAIASNAFKHSRFYNDHNIEKDIADKIFENWMKDSFENEKKRVIVHKSGEEVLGFLLLTINDSLQEIIIELIAVDSKVTAKGIGKELMSDFEYSFSSEQYKKYFFRVGTQVNNITAMNFYIKNDYKIQRESRTYHIWNNKNF